MTQSALKHGDFTGLAANYSKYRPAYAPSVVPALLGLMDKPPAAIEAADVGAGTGIWTRMLATLVRHVTAVEPNDDMRGHGIRDCARHRVSYREGSAEATGLETSSVDLVSMASSFHWADFERATREFHRLLRPGGRFVALWNPRLLEANPILVEIEAELRTLAPDMKRVSSGNSGITETLTERLLGSELFTDVVYVEGRHTVAQSPSQYLGVWDSVNDIRVQLGPERWARFMAVVAERISGLDAIVTTYRTRAWSARRI
ncbi:MAG: class I SAM-dependent methyltransferase [Alphaproteobacteria bacterium]|nr:class I SAM-dependent methyltransferase [Alphaproteobacteria bacterium]